MLKDYGVGRSQNGKPDLRKGGVQVSERVGGVQLWERDCRR